MRNVLFSLIFVHTLVSFCHADELPVVEWSATDSVHSEYPSVLCDNGVYKMWYSGASDYFWRIHYATSDDGIVWRKHGVVLDIGAPEDWDAVSVAFPNVLKLDDGTFLMYYCGHDLINEGYQVG